MLPGLGARNPNGLKNVTAVNSVKLSTIQLLSFRLNDGWDWMKVSFDDDSGLIQIESSFGSYGFIWSAMGEGTKLKNFFVRADKYYLSGKLWNNSHGEEEEFQPLAALEDLKTKFIQERRDGTLDKDEARDLFDALLELTDAIDSHSSQEMFYRAYYESKVLTKWDPEPFHACYGMRPKTRFITLRDELIPIIQEHFKKMIDGTAET